MVFEAAKVGPFLKISHTDLLPSYELDLHASSTRVVCTSALSHGNQYDKAIQQYKFKLCLLPVQYLSINFQWQVNLLLIKYQSENMEKIRTGS